MDRPITKKYKHIILLKQLMVFTVVLVALILIVVFLKNVFIPGVSLSKVAVAGVETGSIQVTVQGSGTVIPAYEEIISAPFRSSIIRIIKKPGDKVKPQDTLLVLDNKQAINDLDMLRNENDLQNIRIEKLKIDLQRLKGDFEFSSRIKEIKVENARLAYEAEQTLNKIGGSPAYNVKKTKTDWDIEQLEFKQLENNFNNQKNSQDNSIRELEMEINIQKNKIFKANDLVDRAYVKAPFAGDISWIIDQPGASVSEGQQIARVADFSDYKLKGVISNAWAGRIISGQKVEIRNQGRILNGAIENIMPTVNQGMMECLVRIDSGDISRLRPAQELEIRVVISSREKVFRLPNGPYYKGRGYKNMYVIKGKRAYRTKILLGDSNFDYVEVLDGVKEGDQVIITDIEDRYSRDEIKVYK